MRILFQEHSSLRFFWQCCLYSLLSNFTFEIKPLSLYQNDVKTSPKTAQTPKIPGCGNGTLLPGGDGGGSQRRYKFRLVGSTAPSNTFIANKSITIPPGTLDPSSRSPCRRLTHFRLTQVPKVPFLAQNRENCSIWAPSGKHKPPRPGFIIIGFRKQPGLLPSPCVH